MSFTSGFILGQSMSKKAEASDDTAGRLLVEEAIVSNGGVIDKVGDVPTHEELAAAIYTILESFPLRVFKFNEEVAYNTAIDSGLEIGFPSMLFINIDEDVTSKTINDELEVSA